jgi:hypothetical protein
MKIKKAILTPLILTIVMMTSFLWRASAQEKKQIVRLAKLVIDSAKLESYLTSLKEGIETSVRDNPTHITILEIYADAGSYKTHLLTSHFIKYKTETKDMIKSLELVETIPISPGMKIK